MTEDIFAPDFGTLDVIIFATLRFIGLDPASFYPTPANTIDSICEHNARMFVEEHIGEPIEAIAMIREATGLNLRDAKNAWLQTVESYYGNHEYHVAAAKAVVERGDTVAAMYHIKAM